MKAVERAYYNVQAHVTNGEELKKISSQTRKGLTAMIEEKIEVYSTMPKTWNYGQGAEIRAYTETLKKMLAVVTA